MRKFLYSMLGWTNGQILNFEKSLDTAKQLLTFKIPSEKIVATILIIVELFFSGCFKTPITPRGEAPDLTGYSLVFEDNFDGTALNTDVWLHRGEGERRTGFNADSQAVVQDGNLVLTGEYLQNGKYGAGWYTGAVALKENYTRGYFEIRCKCNEGDGFWSAFWLQSATENPYDHYLSDGGIQATEVDIFESANQKSILTGDDIIETNIHCNGYDNNIEKLDSQRVGNFRVGDIHEYNTYALKWTDKEYIFYINGKESARSSFAKGVCINPEQVILSLEIPDTLPKAILANQNYKTQMVVDYIRIYQITDQ